MRTSRVAAVAIHVVFGSVVTASATPAPAVGPSTGAVAFEPPPPPVDSPLGLDSSGTTIPDTDYPIPDDAIFMATDGNDRNNGTESSPVRTLNRAISLVPTEGTIVVREGVYRDWHHNADGTSYAIVRKGATIQSYPGEQVWFDGTDVIPTDQWVNSGDGAWHMDWETPSFCNGEYYELPPTNQRAGNSGPCSHRDMSSSPRAPIAGDPQMVFVDGVALAQQPTLAEIDETAFYYDWDARRIYIGTDPDGRTVELAARPVAFVLGGPGNTVRGVGFRRYATNQYHNLTGAALYLGGTGPNQVENAVFVENAGGALNLSNPRPGSYVQSSVFAHNGYTALGANGGTRRDFVNDFVIEQNMFNGNNAEDFGWGCTRACGQASAKLGHMNGFTFRDNVVENAVGRANGFWCDLDCRDGVIVNNLIRDNGGKGIYYEVSRGGIIASNLVTGSGQPGITVASATTKVYNNTLVDNQFGIWVYDDGRTFGVDGWNDVGPDTSDVELVNNIVSDEPTFLVKSQDPRANLSINTRPGQYFSEFDFNAYYRANGPDQPLYNWIEGTHHSYTSSAEFTAATGWDGHAIDISRGGDPFFVDPDHGDYRVRQDSPAHNSGKPLPKDVASLLGLEPGAEISRGAIDWPGSDVSGAEPDMAPAVETS